MAKPQVQMTRVIQRETIEQQLVANRARLQEIQEQLDLLEEQREAAEQQVVAAKAALEGFDLGYAQHGREVEAEQAAEKEATKAEKKAEKAEKKEN